MRALRPGGVSLGSESEADRVRLRLMSTSNEEMNAKPLCAGIQCDAESCPEFREAVGKIRAKYCELKRDSKDGTAPGWRFLYTPAKTFDRGTKLVFLGLNPGGDGGDGPASVENGNAFRLERWHPQALQEQVRRFYRLVATAARCDETSTLLELIIQRSRPSWLVRWLRISVRSTLSAGANLRMENS